MHKPVKPILSKIFTAAILVTVWLTFYYEVVIALLIFICALIGLFIARAKYRWQVLLFSPFVIASAFSFVAGIADYCAGNATEKTGNGKVSDEFFNLDPELRVWHRMSEYASNDNELFTYEPSNLAIEMCTKLFGRQRGVYKGYYPEKRTVIDSLKNVQPIRYFGNKQSENAGWLGYKSITFNYNGDAVKIKDSRREFLGFFYKCDSAKVLILNNECILFQPVSYPRRLTVFLADRKQEKYLLIITIKKIAMAKTDTKDLLKFLKPFSKETQELVLWLREFAWGVCPDTNELIYDNYNALAIGWSPTEKVTHTICSVAAYRGGTNVHFGFYWGSQIADREKMLLGAGNQYRYLLVKDKKTFPKAYITKLIHEAHANCLAKVKDPKLLKEGLTITKSISAAKREPKKAKTAKKI